MSSNSAQKLLNSIFLSNQSIQKPYPIIKSASEIQKIYTFLNDQNTPITDKIFLISTLKSLSNENINIIPYLMEKCTSYNSNLYEPLIKLYLNPKIENENLTKIEELLKILITNITTTKTTINYIYQRLSNYFTSDNPNIKEKLNEKLFFRYLKLLHLFYTDNYTNEEPNQLTTNSNEEKRINNYMYFHGKDSSLIFKINKSSNNVNSDFPTLEYGFSFVFWLKLNKTLFESYLKYYPNIEINFINLEIPGHKIILKLNNSKFLVLLIDNSEMGKFELEKKFIFDSWNIICFNLGQKKGVKLPYFKLYINDKSECFSVQLPQDLPVNEKILNIKIFENLIGRVITVLFCSFCIENKLWDYLCNSFKYGFYKNKLLFQFLYRNEKEYFKNSQDYYYCNKFKKEHHFLKFLNMNSIQQNVKNLTTIFCPFTFNITHKQRYIDDICGNFIGVLSEKDGVNNYINMTKSIQQIGGINNLLPIVELMYSSIANPKNIAFNLVDKSILTEATFSEFLLILKCILIGHHDNLINAFNQKFFSSLSLFLEKFPSSVYTENILDIFLEIGKESFQFTYYKTTITHSQTFLSMILLNENIFSKFNSKNQLKLWDVMIKFFTSDYSQMKESLKMSKICLLLRFYDEKRYNEFCCMYHASHFQDNNKKIMEPEMSVKVDKLFDIIQIYIDKLDQDEESVYLFKLLTLDLSPCLQNKIIGVYISHFLNNKISNDVKSYTIKNLMDNNFCDIFEYVLSISLIDVRISLLTLLDIIITQYKNIIIQNTNINNIYEFIGDNLLPEQLVDDKNERVSKHFNKKEYESQMEIFWKLLTGWATRNTGKKTNKGIELDSLMIDFCLKFCSKNSVRHYINDFINFVFKCLKNNSINNKEVLFDNINVYQWTIQTIFYFYNTENCKNIDNNLCKKIKENALKLFNELFSIKDNVKITIEKKIQCILDYSYSCKLKMNKNQLKQIEDITRMLLINILDCEKIDIEYKVVACYEYIIFYKNGEKYFPETKNEKVNLDYTNTVNDSSNEKKNQLKSCKTITFSNKETRKKSGGLISLDENLNINIDYNKLIENEKIVPEVIEKNLFFDEKKTWLDFSIFSKIINFFEKNLWGSEKLCKNVKIESKNRGVEEIFQTLLKEYYETKANRNILYQDLLKYLNISNKKILDDDNAINILSINLQLLCIQYNLTKKESTEINNIEKLIQQFLLYCILASININNSEKNYDLIQDKLYDILGLCILILKYRNPKLHKRIINKIIIPIFEQINPDQKKSIRKIFTFQKKNNCSNSALFKLFTYIDKTNENSTGNMRLNLRASISTFINPKRLNLEQEGEEDVQNTSGGLDDSSLGNKNISFTFNADPETILRTGFENSFIFFILKMKEINLEKNINNLYDYPCDNIIINTEERKRVNKSIKRLIPLVENQIIKYSNNSFLAEKKRRNNYKSTKRGLFSWNGFWSNKYLFYEHPELLKYKKMNHLTKEMTEILLKPVIDVDYYMPIFKKFDKKKLFNVNNYNYKINLDVDNILICDISDQETKNKNKINSSSTKKLNYLECIYKNSYNELWDKYKSFYEKKIEFEKNGLVSKASYDILASSKEISKDIEKMKVENIYYCCMVKVTNHIRGYISTEKNSIKFIYESEKYHIKREVENDSGYDKDMSSCFGSIFNGHPKDKDIINLEIKYNNIKYMFIRVYFYGISSIEIFTDFNKSYLLVFKNNKDLNQFINDILNHCDYREIIIDDTKNVIGYVRSPPSANKKIPYLISRKYEKWKNYQISTLELLSWLNIYSGRSYNDLTQYPVFPWIITNYESDELNNEKDFRDLSLPMGMIGNSDKSELRQETFNEIYESVKNDLKENFSDFNYQTFLKKGTEYYLNYIQKKNENEEILQANQLPYFYGTHYSNPTYISHYLTRIFPYSLIAIEIQGEKFDDPDRLFTSMKKTFETATTLKDDVRELIPEFYTLPEMFMNINNLDLIQGKADFENKIKEISNVELPPWSENSPHNFVVHLRRELEKNNLKINKWFDLIFGSKQRGERAEEAKNIFMGHSYQDLVKIEKIENEDSKNALLRLVEVGITPSQLFDNDCKPKTEIDQFLLKNNDYSQAKGKLLTESNNIIIEYVKTTKYTRICEHFYQNPISSTNKDYKISIYPKIIKILWINNENLKLFTNNNICYSIKHTKPEEESNLYTIENNSSKFASSYIISGINIPVIVYKQGKYILKGGYWDGRIEINSTIASTNSDEIISTCVFPNKDDPVVVMEMSKNEDILLCGTKKGFLIGYYVYNQKFEIKYKQFNHNEEITSIAINDTLNMFASVSKDGLIMIHILPTFQLVRTIQISKKNNEDFVYADNIFLSSTPLPCITIYISSKRLFKTYTINGNPIYEMSETGNSEYIKSPFIFHDLNFQEFLIYGTNDGFIKIRKFPEMDLVNSVEFLDGQPIETLALSTDNRFCYAWSNDNKIAIIHDSEASIIIDKKENLNKSIS